MIWKAIASVAAALALATPVLAQEKPAAAAKISLTRLDCGTVRVNRLNAFSDTEAYPGQSRDLTVEYDRANGYAHTSPTDAFKAKLAEAGVDLSVRFARVMPKAKAKAEREKAHRYVCPVCGQEVRTTSELSLICGHCNVNMDRLD